MKKTLLTTMLTLFAAFAATAEESGPTIMCITIGNDTYTDGTTVLKDELYALVWTKENTFGGFNADGSLVNVSDKLVRFLCGADHDPNFHQGDNMGLPLMQFQIPAAEAATYDSGYLHIVMLDTRNADGTLSTPIVVSGSNVKPAAVNGYEAKGTTQVSKGFANAYAYEGFPIRIASESSIPVEKYKKPVIVGISFDGDGDNRKMMIAVTNTASYLRYTSGDVTLGSESLPTTKGATAVNGGEKDTDAITVTVPAVGTNQLFRIIRKGINN